MKKLNPAAADKFTGYWAMLINEAPDHTDKKKVKNKPLTANKK